MTKIKKSPTNNKIELKELIDTYLPPTDIMDDMDGIIQEITEIIKHLNDSERNIILYYTELGTIKKVAEILNISTATVSRYIKKIKHKIKLLHKEHYGK